MNFIKSLFYKLLQLIDDGRFLIKPTKWFYYFKGIVPFIVPIVFLFVIIKESPRFLFMNARLYTSEWVKIVAFILAFVFLAYLVFLVYINFLFWVNRAKKLEKVVRKGDSVVAIPLFADNIKNNGEILAILLSCAVIGWCLIIILFYFLSGYQSFYTEHFFENLLYIVLVVVLISCGSLVVSFFIIIITHFIAEKLRMFAQMCNDLRDVADIHRAATILNNKDGEELVSQSDATQIEQS